MLILDIWRNPFSIVHVFFPWCAGTHNFLNWMLAIFCSKGPKSPVVKVIFHPHFYPRNRPCCIPGYLGFRRKTHISNSSIPSWESWHIPLPCRHFWVRRCSGFPLWIRIRSLERVGEKAQLLLMKRWSLYFLESLKIATEKWCSPFGGPGAPFQGWRCQFPLKPNRQSTWKWMVGIL